MKNRKAIGLERSRGSCSVHSQQSYYYIGYLNPLSARKNRCIGSCFSPSIFFSLAEAQRSHLHSECVGFTRLYSLHFCTPLVTLTFPSLKNFGESNLTYPANMCSLSGGIIQSPLSPRTEHENSGAANPSSIAEKEPDFTVRCDC